MGEAKQREKREAAQRARFDAVDFARVAAAVRAYLAAASTTLPLDALTHARLAQHLLQCAGLESDVVIGFAAWRVGPGDGDVIAHGGAGDPAADAGRAGADVPPHHAWLETGGHVFDVTTHQLARKAAEAGPQRETPISVTWCPEFVLTPRASLASFARVRQPVVGLMYYERDAYLQSVLGARAGEPDSAQVACVERIYRELVMAPGTDRQSPAA
jgi:hypothetical protein